MTRLQQDGLRHVHPGHIPRRQTPMAMLEESSAKFSFSQNSRDAITFRLMVERTKIQSFCNAVAKQFHPRKIILFGSHASGKTSPDSDVDLLVIMPRARHGRERISVRIRQAVPRDFPLDLLVRTPAEVAKRLRWGDSFFREVMDCGKVMYEAADA